MQSHYNKTDSHKHLFNNRSSNKKSIGTNSSYNTSNSDNT